MKKNQAIRKFISALLLLVFSVSSAPKAYFHDLVAHHKDYSDCNQTHKTTVLHKQGYNCHFDDLVVSAPFVLQAGETSFFIDLHYAGNPSLFYSCFIESFSRHKENRGPPAIFFS